MKRCDLKRPQKMEREGTAVTCDGRLLHRQVVATRNTVTDSGQRNMSNELKITLGVLTRLKRHNLTNGKQSPDELTRNCVTVYGRCRQWHTGVPGLMSR